MPIGEYKGGIRMNLKLKYFVLLFLLITVAACKDDIVESTPAVNEEDNNNEMAKFSYIQANVLNTSCATSGCHVAGAQTPNLTGNSYNSIVNKQSSSGLDYIEPGDPNSSYLYLKITGTEGISGSRMPLGSSALSQNVIDSIRVWIENGAQNN